MASVRTYTFQPELIARFENLVPTGQRSLIIAKIVSEYCDACDGAAVQRKSREKWIVSTIVPFLQKYAKDNKMNEYSLISSKAFSHALKSAGIEATSQDLKEAVEYIDREDQKNGRAS